jgi:hypothetical protein
MNHNDQYNFTQITEQSTFVSVMNSYLTNSRQISHILKPINGELKAKLQKMGSLDLSLPQVIGDLSFEDVC